MSDTEAVAKPERFETLDVLRGLGVLGILTVNVVAFAYPWQAYQNPMNGPFPFQGGEVTGWFASHVFFELKFITLFSMLFGASLYLVGGERTDVAKGRVLRRRLFWLLLFGTLHGALIWFGDILLPYALCGLVVALCRSWRAGLLLRVGIIFLCVGAVSTAAIAALGVLPGDALSSSEIAALGEAYWRQPDASLLETIGQFRGDLATVARGNFDFWWGDAALTFFGFTFWRSAGVMMIGLALFKMGLLQGKGRSGAYWLWIFGGALALVVIGLQAKANIEADFAFPQTAGGGLLANYFLSPLVTLGYIGLVVLLLRAHALGLLGRALAATGQMAFTNYILQSVLMTCLFWGGRGPVWFAEVDRPMQWALVAVVWLATLLWSPLWMARFQYGPLEWVWRKLSYGGAVQLRRA